MTLFKKSWITLALACWLWTSFAHAMDVTFEEDRSLPIVRISLALKAGAVTDPKGQDGITNFMGEMLLRGTRSKTKEQIDLALDQMGAQLAVDTRSEFMVLRGAVLSSQLDKFLDLVREIATEPTFPARQITKLKAEMVSGILDELSDDESLDARKFQEFLFLNHPYGIPVNGKIKTIEALTRAKIIRHYEDYMHDQNLLVVGSGDADKAKIEDWAKSIAKRLPTGHKLVVETVPPPTPSPDRRLMIVDKPDRSQTQMNIGQIGIKMTSPEFFPLVVGNHILGGGSFSSRLFADLRMKHGWTYGASSGFMFGRQPRYWKAALFPQADKAAPALAETIHVIEQTKKSGVTQDEFNFAQNSLVNQSGFMYNTPAKRVENALLEKTLGLPDGFMKSWGPNIQKLKIGEVNDALRSFLKPNHLVMVVVGTASQVKEPLAKAAGVPVNKVVVVPYTQD